MMQKQLELMNLKQLIKQAILELLKNLLIAYLFSHLHDQPLNETILEEELLKSLVRKLKEIGLEFLYLKKLILAF